MSPKRPLKVTEGSPTDLPEEPNPDPIYYPHTTGPDSQTGSSEQPKPMFQGGSIVVDNPQQPTPGPEPQVGLPEH